MSILFAVDTFAVEVDANQAQTTITKSSGPGEILEQVTIQLYPIHLPLCSDVTRKCSEST